MPSLSPSLYVYRTFLFRKVKEGDWMLTAAIIISGISILMSCATMIISSEAEKVTEKV
jgi:hypothetical protein